MSALAFVAHHVSHGPLRYSTPCVSTDLAWEGSMGVDVLHTVVDSHSYVVG